MANNNNLSRFSKKGEKNVEKVISPGKILIGYGRRTDVFFEVKNDKTSSCLPVEITFVVSLNYVWVWYTVEKSKGGLLY